MQHQRMDAILRAACRAGGRHCIPFGGLASRRSGSSWIQTGAEALRAVGTSAGGSRRQTSVGSYSGRRPDSGSSGRGRSRSSGGAGRGYAAEWEQESFGGRGSGGSGGSGGSSSKGSRGGGRGGYSFSEPTQRAPERSYGDAEEYYGGRGSGSSSSGRGSSRGGGRSSGRGGYSSFERTRPAPERSYGNADESYGGRGGGDWQQQRPGSSGRGGGRGAGRSSQWERSNGSRRDDRDTDGRNSRSDGRDSDSQYAQQSRSSSSGGGYGSRSAAPYDRAASPNSRAYDDEAAGFDDGGFSEGGGDWEAGDGGRSGEGSGYGGERRMRRRPNDSEDGFEWPLKPSKAALREDLFGEVLYGVAPVLAALRLRRRAIHALYVQDSMDITKRKDAGAVREAVRLAGEAGAAVREIGKHELNMLTDSRPHQGLVLDCGALEWLPLQALPDPVAGTTEATRVAGAASADVSGAVAGGTERREGALGDVEAAGGSSAEEQYRADGGQQQVRAWDDGEADGSDDDYADDDEGGAVVPSAAAGRHAVWLALDEVGDPQNLGAIIRSAYCLGATGILASAKNCAPLSAVVSKASAGVLEAVPLHSCKNMQRTLADAAERGWAVLGASAGRGALPLAQMTVDRPTVLVLGNEGYGLRTNVRRACTQLVRIDMGIPPSTGGFKPVVDSLNVSVAAGILLHHLIGSSRAALPPTSGAAEALEQAATPQ